MQYLVKFLVILCGFAFVHGCAGPQTHTEYPEIDKSESATLLATLKSELFEQRLASLQTLHTVVWDVFKSNVALCHQTSYHYNGLVIGTANAFPSIFDPLEKDDGASLGFSDQPVVIAVANDSPAWQSGLRQKDQLLRVNDQDVTMDTIQKHWTEATAEQQAVRLQVRRHADQSEAVIEFETQNTCDYSVSLAFNRRPNATAWRNRISVTTALVSGSPSENALAMVVGHELAHVIQKHSKEKITKGLLSGRFFVSALTRLVGNVIDGVSYVFVGPGTEWTTQGTKAAYSVESVLYNQRDLEKEADYVGLYLYARTGRSLEEVEAVWRYFYFYSPARSVLPSSHPYEEERILALANTRREILQKLADGAPLLPNCKAADEANASCVGAWSADDQH